MLAMSVYCAMFGHKGILMVFLRSRDACDFCILCYVWSEVGVSNVQDVI